MTARQAKTPTPTSTPSEGEAVSSPDLRLILVGRTGLEGKLRQFGPVRVRTPLEAIGELADPMQLSVHEGEPVVLVAQDIDPGGGASGRAGEFVQALRRVEPSVRVFRVGEAGHGEGAYDGSVSPGESAEAVVRAITRPAAPQAPAPAAPPESREVGSPNELMLDGQDATAHPGDAELVGLMLRGRDIAAAASRLLRERAGDPGLRFVPADAGAPQIGGSIDVSWHGHRFGWLISPSLPPETLAPHARWLAAWLALAAQQSQLRGEAFTDSLTGAWNRRYFERFMESALRASQRERRHLTILVFDIDDFKRYNDQFGHAAGDSILVETVRLLKSVIRPSDKVCRIGGDEFVVIFHEPDGPRIATSKPPDSISQIARRFQRQICEHRFPKLLEQAPGTLTISGGLATFPWDGRTAEELLARADELALQAKRAGKNTIVFGPGASEVCGIADGP